MNKLYTMAAVAIFIGSAFAHPKYPGVKRFRFYKEKIGCAAVHPTIKVIDNKVVGFVNQLCLFGSDDGKWTKPKKIKNTRVEAGKVYFHDVYCGTVEDNGEVKLETRYCYKTNSTHSFRPNSFYLSVYQYPGDGEYLGTCDKPGSVDVGTINGEVAFASLSFVQTCDFVTEAKNVLEVDEDNEVYFKGSYCGTISDSGSGTFQTLNSWTDIDRSHHSCKTYWEKREDGRYDMYLVPKASF